MKRRPDKCFQLAGLLQTLDSILEPDPSWPSGDWPITGNFRPPWFEVVVGAVLTQNTRWEAVEQSLRSLAASGRTSPERIWSASLPDLERTIRPSGFYRRKARTLKAVSRYLLDFGQTLEESWAVDREGLLSVPGIGPETADSILLYALGQQQFVVDAYTCRLLSRLRLIPAEAPYDAVKEFCESELPADVELFKRVHARIVQFGKTFCRRRPLCRTCPLASRCSFGSRLPGNR